jgi:DNA polymerase III sliding clamp (beta) subunit (PCNA family)
MVKCLVGTKRNRRGEFMKFSIKLNELQDILKALRTCVKPSSDEPSARINIFANKDAVYFITSDNLNSIKVTSTTAQLLSEGRVAVLYSKLHPFINSFRYYAEGTGGVEDVVVKLNDKSLSVSVKNYSSDGSCSNTRVRLPCFSEITEDNLFKFDRTDFVLGSSMLKATLDKISFTLDPLHNVTFLRGASLLFTENEIHFAGTNGIVISEYTVKNTSNSQGVSYILSYDFVKSFRNILSFLVHKEESSIEFFIEKGKIKVRTNNIILVGNLIVGYEFPDYRSELLREKKYKLSLGKDIVLANIIPAISSLDKEDNYRLTFKYDGKCVTFYNDNFEASFNVGDEDDCDVKVDVNGRFFKNIINCINDDKILFMFSDENTAMCFDSDMFEDQKCLITPIKRRHE